MSIGSTFKPIATGIGKAAKFLQNNDAARIMAAGALGGASPRYGPELAAHLRPEEDAGPVVDAPVVSPSEQILQGPGGESGAGYAGGGGGGFGPEGLPGVPFFREGGAYEEDEINAYAPPLPDRMEPIPARNFPRLEPLNLPIAERSGSGPSPLMPRPGPGPIMQAGIPGQERRGGFPWDRLGYEYGGGRY